MAINRYRYYLGPLGLMQPIPGMPAGDRDAPMRFSAAEHVAISGRTTQDRFGRVRRQWPVQLAWLTEDQELYVQASIRGQATLDLRLMDPRKRNLAPEDISVGGSQTQSTRSFTDTGAATPAWSSGSLPVELLGVTAGRIVWNSVTNTQTLYGTSEKTPVIAGSTYRISMFTKTTTTCRIGVRPFDLLGAEQATVQSSQFASTAGVWTRRDYLYTPGAGVCSAYFGLIANGSGNIETTGWQYQIDESLANWAFGYGCPAVFVSNEIAASYWRTKYHNLGLMLKEV